MRNQLFKKLKMKDLLSKHLIYSFKMRSQAQLLNLLRKRFQNMILRLYLTKHLKMKKRKIKVRSQNQNKKQSS